MISLSDQWTKIHNFKTNVKPGQKFQLSSQKLIFGNPDETTGVLSALIYPQQTISYLFVKPKIEKIKISMGSIQLKIGNQIENFDVNLEKDEEQNSAQKYFIEILAPMIPKIFTTRIANFIGQTDVDLKYSGKTGQILWPNKIG